MRSGVRESSTDSGSSATLASILPAPAGVAARGGCRGDERTSRGRASRGGPGGKRPTDRVASRPEQGRGSRRRALDTPRNPRERGHRPGPRA